MKEIENLPEQSYQKKLKIHLIIKNSQNKEFLNIKKMSYDKKDVEHF